MTDSPSIIRIDYDPVRVSGRFIREHFNANSSIWERLKARFFEKDIAATVTDDEIEISWPEALDIIREFGSKTSQRTLNFRFLPEDKATEKIHDFLREIKKVKEARNEITITISEEEIASRLLESGFTKRVLKSFQLRDVQHLLSLPHGANFSVPGAGKTSVTFAIHILTRQEGQHLFVVCPKAAFPAWNHIVEECMEANAPNNGSEKFVMLNGNEEDSAKKLRSGTTRFLISYDLLVRQQLTVAAYFASTPVHLVLDESHRMKAGWGSQRGAFLLNVAALPARRDILSGTPMPQAAGDLASQLGFLWPGHGLDLQIQRGAIPRDVLGQLYVRTTKQELGLPPASRSYYQVEMAPGQQALYGIVRNEVLRQFVNISKSKTKNIDFLSARRSVMRMLQISVNPTLALHGMAGDHLNIESGIVDAVVEEGSSTKMRAVAHHARELAKKNQKTVIWTIFTNNILELEGLLVDLNPVLIYGAIPSGEDNDISTREGRLRRFHLDDSCKVLIANPVAAGEGISLHTVCHNAIYLDRSYVSTHYLQSIDRIHRLGLPADIETNIHIYQTKAPASLGSIDLSVSRRLATKIRNLQELLDDPDLHEIALDEENADDPVDYDVDLQDIIDLISELEGKSPEDSEFE